MKYNHFLAIHLTSPNKISGECLERLVTDSLGEKFVRKVTVNIVNEKTPTAKEMDPLSDKYVGHNKARRYGVKCCCDRSVIECPYHGR